MTEPAFPQSPLGYQPPQDLLPFPNRSAHLLTAGILLLLTGLCTGGMTALMPVGLLVPPPPGQKPPTVMDVASSMLIYGLLTTALAWLGIGAMVRRRWARPLTIILTVHWLLIGVISLISTVLMYPILRDMLDAADPNLPPAFAITLLVILLVTISVAFILLPGIILLLVRSENARLTLEHYDPQPRWTDRCTLRVLGLAITLLIAGLMFASGVFSGVLPAFGIVLRGVPAGLVYLVTGGLLVLAAWQVYQTRMSGWWLGLLVIVGFLAAMIPTPLMMPVEEYYRLFKIPDTQLEVFKGHESVLRGMAIGFPVVFSLLWVIYMLRLLPHMTRRV